MPIRFMAINQDRYAVSRAQTSDAIEQTRRPALLAAAERSKESA
jgi:hypothetical protein